MSCDRVGEEVHNYHAHHLSVFGRVSENMFYFIRISEPGGLQILGVYRIESNDTALSSKDTAVMALLFCF